MTDERDDLTRTTDAPDDIASRETAPECDAAARTEESNLEHSLIDEGIRILEEPLDPLPYVDLDDEHPFDPEEPVASGIEPVNETDEADGFSSERPDSPNEASSR